ncbi:MAG: hypothetical protein WC975_09335 [Phycisphaerae bacterium]
MKLLYLLYASIMVSAVVLVLATAPGCGEHRERTRVVRDRHDRTVIVERDRHPRRVEVRAEREHRRR